MNIDFPEQSRNIVKRKGQELSPVLWQGEQWAVTDYGIECRDGCYAIEAKQFFDTNSSWAKSSGMTVQECWYQHMSEKNWVDELDFGDAVDAFTLLFTKNGKRSLVPSPCLMDESDIEEYALQAGNLAYENAKRAAINGVAHATP